MAPASSAVRTPTLTLPVAASVGIHGVVLAVLVVALASEPGREPPGRAVVALEEPVVLEEAPPPPEAPPPEPVEPPPGDAVLEELSPPEPEDPRFRADGSSIVVPSPTPVEGATFLGAGLRGFRGGPRAGGAEAPSTAATAAPAPAGPMVRARPIEDACDRPDYPGRERRRGVEGAVDLLVSVAASGDVEAIDVIESSGSEALDRAAAEAVARWRFSPALRDGGPVADVVRLRVRFTLEDRPLPSPGG